MITIFRVLVVMMQAFFWLLMIECVKLKRYATLS